MYCYEDRGVVFLPCTQLCTMFRERYCTFGTTIVLNEKSEYLERIRSLGSKTLHSTASTTGLVSKSGQSKHSVQMRQEFCKVKCSRISNVMSIHCRESCKRDDRLLNLVMG